MRQRRLTKKSMVMFMLALTILAWATQTLFHQWGFGAELVSEEKFVPAAGAGGSLEIKAEATIFGAEVKLKQICRWSDADRLAFEPVADLVVMRLEAGKAYRTIGIDELKDVLSGAGVNMSGVRISGATTCTVARTDVKVDEGKALKEWAEAKADVSPRTQVAPVELEAQPAAAKTPAPQVLDDARTRTLKEILMADLAARIALPAESLQVSWKGSDEKLLAMSEAQFGFEVSATNRVARLGNVGWEVIVKKDGTEKKLNIVGTARAWRQQVVTTKPIAFKQVIREEDIEEKRMLVDRLEEAPLLGRQQVVGQQAAVELKPGAVLMARNVEAVPLVRTGQLVSVTVAQGGIQVKTQARALESGAYGQNIRVRNDATKDVYEVTMTGPQTGLMGEGASMPAQIAKK
jgi:flagella basal body P-ring formation protein FlgA